jgi:hypothetical protein
MGHVRRILPLLLSSAFLLPGLAAPQHSGDEVLNAAARELADKVIAAGLIPRLEPAVKLLAGNRSSIPAGQFEGSVREFQAELQARGMHTERWSIPSAGLHVTLTESLQDYIWVAFASPEDESAAVITSIPRGAAVQTPPSGPPMILKKQFILSRPEPILDLLFYKLPETGEQRLLVLQPEEVLILRFESGSWKPEGSAALQHDRPWPRDLRGRIKEMSSPNRLQAFFPDAVCDVRHDVSWQASCSVKSVQFPVFSLAGFEQMARFIPHKNYFTDSQVDPNKQLRSAVAYTTAFIGWGGEEAHTISTQLDGRAVLFENPDDTEPVATLRGWGSDIVAQVTDCGQKWQVLATRAGDWTETDAIQAFEIVDRQTVAVSDVVDFPGPVTALWESGSATQAIAVAKNLETGLYEAYSLSLICGH